MLVSVCSRENYIHLLGYLLILLGVTVNKTRLSILYLKQISSVFVLLGHVLLEQTEKIVFFG